MNKVIIIGRTTRAIELRYTTGQSSMAVARFSLAVNRRGKDKGADFISCVAFGKTAEVLDKYVSKGHRIGIVGHIQTGSYEKDGHRVYTTDVVVDELEFLEPRKSDQTPITPEDVPEEDVPDGFIPNDDDLPF